MKIFFSFILLITILFSCTVLNDARVVITNKNDGRDPQNKYFWDVELKNEGEKPAYFVILIITCWKNGNELERKEWAYGDIFPNQKAENRIMMNKVGYDNPDSTTFKITYTATDISNPIK